MEKTLTKPTRNRWWITNFAVPIAVAVAVAVMMLSGCVNGPARCYLNGRFNYLTVETAKNAPWYIIESNDKKFARIKTLKIVVDTLEKACEAHFEKSMA